MRIRPAEGKPQSPVKIKVIGVGGGGNNAVNEMIINSGSFGDNVEFIVANTDAQALSKCVTPHKILLGEKLTRGLGAGGDPRVGRAAAEESEEKIYNSLVGAQIVFVTAGMGGGTGTGGAPVVARIAKEKINALTIGVVTRPFKFEQAIRRQYAEEGIKELRKHVDMLIVVPNDKIFEVIKDTTPLVEAFSIANDVLENAIKSFCEIINNIGLINIDVKDIQRAGTGNENVDAAICIGIGNGPRERVRAAAEKALSLELYDDIDISSASHLIVYIVGPTGISAKEIKDGLEYISTRVPASDLRWGQAIDDTLVDRVKVIIIATGIGKRESLPPEIEEELRSFDKISATSDFQDEILKEFLIPAALERK
jgi:cell division protein FtsZ